MLDRVTLTGADDSVEPEDLLEISRMFPFVEWGILVSRSSSFAGRARFPSVKWVKRLFEAVEAAKMGTGFGPKYQFSCHLCGEWVRDIFSGNQSEPLLQREWPWLLPTCYANYDPGLFQRVQFNFHAQKGHSCPPDASRLSLGLKQAIFQIDGANDFLFEWAVNAGANAVPLFDMSGGAGIVPNEWPVDEPYPYRLATSARRPEYFGYAGGLGPDNLKEECTRIFKAAGSRRIWIDMETKIRSRDDHVFDLDKCIKVLSIAKEAMHGTAT